MALFLRDFTVLDFAFLSKEKGLQGESLHVSVELEGELDEKGFLFDFGPAKRELKRVVDETLDHRLVVPGLDPALQGTAHGFSFHGLTYGAPAEAITVLEEKEITIPALARFLEEEARAVLPPNVKGVRFLLEEEKRFETEAAFRYTHGLRLHNGNCQRLLHGHRNAIEVWVEGKRDARWERFLAEEWEGAHFTYAPTLASSLDYPRGRRMRGEGLAWVEYEAPQGFFRAGLPAEKIVLLDTEPSIENIARVSAERLALEGVKAAKVVAYEGLNKGASFSLSRP
jgi:6-pyruvoyl-tetrahydropterin synthase